MGARLPDRRGAPSRFGTAEPSRPPARPSIARDLLVFGLVVLPIVTLGTLSCFGRRFGPLVDGVDYAQIARNLLEGHGFRSDVALPVSIAFPFGRALPQPLLYRPPAFPLALVPFLAAFGARDAGVLAAGIAFALLAGAVTYLLGRTIRGRALGFGAAAVVTIHNSVWNEAGHGYAEPLAVFLVAALLWLLLARRPALAGLVLGALVLTKAHLLAIAPALLAPAWLRGRGRWRDLALFGAGALVAVAPWAARNVAVTGRPFFDLHAYTEAQQARAQAPVYEFHRRADVVSAQTVLRHDPLRVLARIGRTLRLNARVMPLYLGWGTIALFALAVASPAPIGLGRDFRRVLLVSVGLFVLALAPTSMIPRYFLPLLPLVAIGGLDAMGRLVAKRSRIVRTASVAALALLLARPPGGRLARAAIEIGDGRLGLPSPPATATLRAGTAPTDVVVSDDLSIAWYARRRVVWLPWNSDALHKVDAAFPIDAVYLRGTSTEIRCALGDSTWDAIADFVQTECERAVPEPDSSGWLYVRRRSARR